MILREFKVCSFKPMWNMGKYIIQGVVEDDDINNGYADWEVTVQRRGNEYFITFSDDYDIRECSDEKYEELTAEIISMLKKHVVTDDGLYSPSMSLSFATAEDEEVMKEVMGKLDGQGLWYQSWYDTFCMFYRKKWGFDFTIGG